MAFNELSRAAILQLDAWLQEEILDELDRIAQRPGQLRRAGSSPVCIADMTRSRDNLQHYVFLSIEAIPATRTLAIVGIGHYARPAGWMAG